MIPKLEEAFGPLEAGVGCMQVVTPAELADALRRPGDAGTLLLPG